MGQNYVGALLYVSIKQSSLKILRYLLFFLYMIGVSVWNRNTYPQSRIAAHQTSNKIDSLDQKRCHMTLSVRKN